MHELIFVYGAYRFMYVVAYSCMREKGMYRVLKRGLDVFMHELIFVYGAYRVCVWWPTHA